LHDISSSGFAKDTNNSGEFEYPTDSLVEEMTTSLNAVIVRYEV
jgi:hypothetical protein